MTKATSVCMIDSGSDHDMRSECGSKKSSVLWADRTNPRQRRGRDVKQF